ncbi:MAG: DUF2191 domain-containing protein [Planctomycetota bacterium]|nr:DUF2191 domain-containing protein [Planctomycetota bacterium]
MRTTVDLDDSLLRRAKELAARTHRTLTSVLEDALRETLSRTRARARRKCVVLPKSTQRPGVLAGVDLDSSAGLLDVMERDDASARR